VSGKPSLPEKYLSKHHSHFVVYKKQILGLEIVLQHD